MGGIGGPAKDAAAAATRPPTLADAAACSGTAVDGFAGTTDGAAAAAAVGPADKENTAGAAAGPLAVPAPSPATVRRVLGFLGAQQRPGGRLLIPGGGGGVAVMR